jgi:hypothetical protein
VSSLTLNDHHGLDLLKGMPVTMNLAQKYVSNSLASRSRQRLDRPLALKMLFESS